MKLPQSRLLVVSLLLIIGVQPAVPRSINYPTSSHRDGNERTPSLPPFNRGDIPCKGSFQYIDVPAESNHDEDQTIERSTARVGDTVIHQWGSGSNSGGSGYYICQEDEGIIPSDDMITYEVPPASFVIPNCFGNYTSVGLYNCEFNPYESGDP